MNPGPSASMNGMVVPDEGFKGQPPLSQYNMKKEHSFETYSRSSMAFNSAGKAGGTTAGLNSYDDL